MSNPEPEKRRGTMAERQQARMELWEATPGEVWRMYQDNGYTWAKMIDEELSHADENI